MESEVQFMIDYQKNIGFFKKTLDEEVKWCNRIAQVHTAALKSVELWKGKIKEITDREKERLESEKKVIKKEEKKIDKQTEKLEVVT